MTMRERIARALYDATPFKETAGGYDAQSDVYKRMCLLLADAVLAAMAEPTEAMIKAGEWGSALRSMADSYRAMLAAAGEPE